MNFYTLLSKLWVYVFYIPYMTLLDLISHFFILSLIIVTLILNKCHKTIIAHGYTNKMVSKNLFALFYLFGLFLIRNNTNHTYTIHLARRLLETLIFRYTSKNRMSVLQFATGMAYYYFIIYNITGVEIIKAPFIAWNVLQFIAHYCIFIRGYNIYAHYYCEIGLYATVFISSGSVFFFLNMVWICVYTYVSVANRKLVDRKNK